MGTLRLCGRLAELQAAREPGQREGSGAGMALAPASPPLSTGDRAGLGGVRLEYSLPNLFLLNPRAIVLGVILFPLTL